MQRTSITITLFVFLSVNSLLSGQRTHPGPKELSLIRKYRAKLRYRTGSDEWFTELNFEPEGKMKIAHLSEVPRLEILYFTGCTLEDKDMRQVGELTHLRALYVPLHSRFTAKGWAQIGRLKHLEVLDLCSLRLDDNALRTMKLPTSLKRLFLTGNDQITDDGLIWLKHLHHLEHLDLSARSITGVGFRHLAGLRKLTSLSVEAAADYIDEHPRLLYDLMELGKLTQIRKLELSYDRKRLGAKGLKPLVGLTHLEELVLEVSDAQPEPNANLPADAPPPILNDDELKTVSNIKSLRRFSPLNVDDSPESVHALSHLTALPMLERLLIREQIVWAGLKDLYRLPIRELQLNEEYLNDEAWKHLKQMPRLSDLYLGDLKVTKELVQHLKQLPHLEIIETGRELREADLELLCELTNLIGLDRSRQPVEDSWLRHVGKLRQLKYLTLSDTCVTDSGLKHLQGLTRVEALSLDRSGILGRARPSEITDAGVAQLKQFPELRRLDLNGHPKITSESLAVLMEMKNLEQVQIDSPKLSEDDVRKFRLTRPGIMIDTEGVAQTGVISRPVLAPSGDSGYDAPESIDVERD